MMTAVDVSAACRRLLPTLDLDSTTERMVRELVARELGAPIDGHKLLIKEEIDRYLSATAEAGPTATVTASAPGTATRNDADYVPTATELAADGDDDDDDDYTGGDDEDGDFEGAGGKRKRGAGAAGGRGAKQPRASGGGRGAAAAAAAGPGGKSWRLGATGRKYARVECWKGSWRVDLREFYEKDGQLMPGAKGIALSPDEWGTLAAALPALGAALQARDESYSLQLTESRRATARAFNNAMLADIREYYQAGSDWKPGKKGVALSPDALKGLADAAADITAALPAAAAAAARAVAAAAAGGGGGAAAEGAAADFVDLGGKKRARINVFKGSKYVDLREFYEKDGEQLPGKKGIALTEADWATVKGAMAAAAEAAQRRDLAYCVQLSGKRKVSLSEFKGTLYVGVREFYDKDGKELPGTKGLNMTLEQWNKLVAGAALLDSLLAAA